jgi:hypothetical protein
MKRAAIGVRMHSGWGAVVAVSEVAGAPEIVVRHKLVVVAPGAAGAKQPYHFAETLDLAAAEKHLANCLAASTRLAWEGVGAVVNELRDRRYRVVGAAVLLASGRGLPPLPNILASHALIHTAEGEFFRDIFSRACGQLDLSVTRIRERDLDQSLGAAFGKSATRLQRQVSDLGHSLGAPWTVDQKTAALAALVVLGSNKR